MADLNNEELIQSMHDRYLELPKVVQEAITSADVENELRQLSEGHKLHLDQWDKLQTEVMLALLGFQPVEELPVNIANNVGVDGKEAEALSADINRIVFEPIRVQLERELGHPEAKSEFETMDPVEQVREQILSQAPMHRPLADVLPSSLDVTAPPIPGAAPVMTMPTEAATPAPAPTVSPTLTLGVAPATPPIPAPETTVERAPVSTSYVNTASHERKDVAGDPYREQVT